MFNNETEEEARGKAPRQAILLAVAFQGHPVSTGLWTDRPRRLSAPVSDPTPTKGEQDTRAQSVHHMGTRGTLEKKMFSPPTEGDRNGRSRPPASKADGPHR